MESSLRACFNNNGNLISARRGKDKVPRGTLSREIGYNLGSLPEASSFISGFLLSEQ